MAILGLDLKQLAVILGAVAGSGGLVRLDAGRLAGANYERTTATASLSVEAFQRLTEATERLERLEARIRRLERQRGRTGADHGPPAGPGPAESGPAGVLAPDAPPGLYSPLPDPTGRDPNEEVSHAVSVGGVGDSLDSVRHRVFDGHAGAAERWGARLHVGRFHGSQ